MTYQCKLLTIPRHFQLVGAGPRRLKSTIAATTDSTTCTKNNHLFLSKVPRNRIIPQSIVEKPEIKSALPLIGNGAYLALAAGFLMTDMLSLRILLASGYTGLVTFHMLQVKPLKIPLRWSALFVLVNAGAAGILLADQWMGNLSPEDRKLYHDHFPMLSPGQFQQLLQLSRSEVLPDGTALTEEGKPAKNLYFIQKGVANMYLKELFMAESAAGSFVNDVAFQQGPGAGAYGTTVTSGECTVLIWDKEELRAHLESRPAMNQNMKHCLASHLVKALMDQREAAHLTSGQWSKYQVPSFLPRKTVADFSKGIRITTPNIQALDEPNPEPST